MIQDIQPHNLDASYSARKEIGADDYVFHFNDNLLLLEIGENKESIPRKKDITDCPDEGIYLFALNGISCFLISSCHTEQAARFAYHPIHFPHTITRKELDWACSLALQLHNWHDQNRFCGKCGTETQPCADERALECPMCKSRKYPSVTPAIIVAIQSDEKLLLARGANFPEGYFSLIAGYVEIGETIEQTVAREVKEEVGIDIKNVQYAFSQPWPFSGSMMLGFTATADSDQPIVIDKKEIAEARWFTKDTMPQHPPERSIAGVIIEQFKRGEL